jgi:HEPN domain-containing protein
MRTLKPILFLAALIVAATSHAAGLSEQSVRELIAKMDQAARTRSIEPLAEVLSDDAVIRVTVHIERRKRVLDLTKEDYLEMVRRGWARASAYTFQRTALDITIQNPERARVTTEVLESLSVQGQSMQGRTRQEATVELRRGRPRITRLDATAAPI